MGDSNNQDLLVDFGGHDVVKEVGGQRARERFSKLLFLRNVVFGGQKPNSSISSTRSADCNGGLRRQTSSVPKEMSSCAKPQSTITATRSSRASSSVARQRAKQNAVFSSFTSITSTESSLESKPTSNKYSRASPTQPRYSTTFVASHDEIPPSLPTPSSRRRRSSNASQSEVFNSLNLLHRLPNITDTPKTDAVSIKSEERELRRSQQGPNPFSFY